MCWDLIWQCAGIVGIDPGPFTLRELALMAETKRKADWERTASLIAHTLNLWSKKKYKPSDFFNFNDHAQKSAPVQSGPKQSVKILKAVFVDNFSGRQK